MVVDVLHQIGAEKRHSKHTLQGLSEERHSKYTLQGLIFDCPIAKLRRRGFMDIHWMLGSPESGSY